MCRHGRTCAPPGVRAGGPKCGARNRRRAPRRKGVTVAAGAAIFATPTLASVAGAPGSGSGGGAPHGASTAQIASIVHGGGGRTRLLAYGDTGEAVLAVQHQLVLHGQPILQDGIFGPQTEGAVKAFQTARGLAPTGVVNAATWAALFGSRVLFYDDSGSAGASTAAPSAASAASPSAASAPATSASTPAAS